MPPAFRLPFALAAGCAALVALSGPAFGVAEAPAQSPEALKALLVRYDKEPAGGGARQHPGPHASGAPPH